jgi:hypothetical protein
VPLQPPLGAAAAALAPPGKKERPRSNDNGGISTLGAVATGNGIIPALSGEDETAKELSPATPVDVFEGGVNDRCSASR